MPYHETHNGWRPWGLYGYPDYPDGQLRTSARQLGSFLAIFMNYGSYRGVRVLRHESVAEMRRNQFPGVAHHQGLIWYRWQVAGRHLMGHIGGDWGVSTFMFFSPDPDVGAIVLANGDPHGLGGYRALRDVMSRLFVQAEGL